VIRSIPVEEFEQLMREGVVRDNCTLSAWGLYLLWKKEPWLTDRGRSK